MNYNSNIGSLRGGDSGLKLRPPAFSTRRTSGEKIISTQKLKDNPHHHSQKLTRRNENLK